VEERDGVKAFYAKSEKAWRSWLKGISTPSNTKAIKNPNDEFGFFYYRLMLS